MYINHLNRLQNHYNVRIVYDPYQHMYVIFNVRDGNKCGPMWFVKTLRRNAEEMRLALDDGCKELVAFTKRHYDDNE